MITATTTGNGGNHGDFSGSAITFTFFSNLGEGEYLIANKDFVVANPTKKFVAVDCINAAILIIRKQVLITI
ncbi:hypothetical protein [Siphonobacter sp. SORGH_AS_1065]|uniref:hypothetical protein n=1 Tax=Siphonobacter sp. SORGH_AS_1065 TaxID=3041795 RepID=UPI00278B0428|nr:hypothetical protein [Siphonobacter sp. SORGH_AS_1065]MDQ1090476.1 methyl coenzyme M reductase beta subunit [Siphonobacter sp. SORGH_AS_1065]